MCGDMPLQCNESAIKKETIEGEESQIGVRATKEVS
jgi:hypothetical protein